VNKRKAVDSERLAVMELAKKCLGRISDIASRGARSKDARCVGGALIFLSTTLSEYVAYREKLRAPGLRDWLPGLRDLDSELDIIDRLVAKDLASR